MFHLKNTVFNIQIHSTNHKVKKDAVMKASSIPQSHPIHFVSNFTDEKEIVFTVHPVKSNEIVETNECKLQAANVVENEILVPDGGIRVSVPKNFKLQYIYIKRDD